MAVKYIKIFHRGSPFRILHFNIFQYMMVYCVPTGLYTSYTKIYRYFVPTGLNISSCKNQLKFYPYLLI